MKLLILALLISSAAYGQSTYYIRADSVRFQKTGGNTTFILENQSRAKTGAYLRNYGNGRTDFYYAVDSASVSGSNLILWRGGGTQNITIPVGGSGSSFNYDSLSMIDIRDYWGVSVQWTTGSISSGTPTLTLAAAKDFAIGQVITVEGAGAAGVNLRATILNIVGTTVTLDANAGTNVTAQRVRHDCTPGIQLALIDAIVSPKRSTLWVPADTAAYVISGPLVTSVNSINPNAQLYIPLVQTSSKMVTLKILGSTPPNMASEGIAAVPRNTQGVIFESTLTTEASGTAPSVLGTSFYTTGANGDKNYINTVLENLIVRTATKNPAGTDIAGTMSAINFRKMTQKSFINVKADISSNLIDRVTPTAATYGIVSPEVNNKAELDNQKIFVEGYKFGYIPGEHENTFHYIGGGNVEDVIIEDGFHSINITRYTGELNHINISLRGTGNLHINDYETERSSTAPFIFLYDIVNIGGTSTVSIDNGNIVRSGVGRLSMDSFVTIGNPKYTIYGGGYVTSSFNAFKTREQFLGAAPLVFTRSTNGRYNGSGWVLDSTALHGVVEVVDPTQAANAGYWSIYKIPSGSGTRTATQSLAVNLSTGFVEVPTALMTNTIDPLTGARVTINGTIMGRNDAATDYNIISFNGSTADATFAGMMANPTFSTDPNLFFQSRADIYFRINGNTAAGGIHDNGFWGMGTAYATPTQRLQVVGNIDFSGALMPNATAGASGSALISGGAGAPPTWITQAALFATFIGNGTYTPTLTNTANLDASTSHVFQYHWIKDPTTSLVTVTVSGYVEVDPTTTLTDTQLRLTVPVNTNFGNIQEASGNANSPIIAAQSAGILAVVGGNQVVMQWKTTDVTNQSMQVHFTYKVTPP